MYALEVLVIPRSNSVMIHRLQQAINDKSENKIIYQKSQFYSEDKKCPVTTYSIKKAVQNEETGKYENVTVFKTTSQIQVVLYLRDMWYEINGWEVPTDNETWNKVKENIDKGD